MEKKTLLELAGGATLLAVLAAVLVWFFQRES